MPASRDVKYRRQADGILYRLRWCKSTFWSLCISRTQFDFKTLLLCKVLNDETPSCLRVIIANSRQSLQVSCILLWNQQPVWVQEKDTRFAFKIRLDLVYAATGSGCWVTCNSGIYLPLLHVIQFYLLSPAVCILPCLLLVVILCCPFFSFSFSPHPPTTADGCPPQSQRSLPVLACRELTDPWDFLSNIVCWSLK